LHFVAILIPRCRTNVIKDCYIHFIELIEKLIENLISDIIDLKQNSTLMFVKKCIITAYMLYFLLLMNVMYAAKKCLVELIEID